MQREVGPVFCQETVMADRVYESTVTLFACLNDTLHHDRKYFLCGRRQMPKGFELKKLKSGNLQDAGQISNWDLWRT